MILRNRMFCPDSPTLKDGTCGAGCVPPLEDAPAAAEEEDDCELEYLEWLKDGLEKRIKELKDERH